MHYICVRNRPPDTPHVLSPPTVVHRCLFPKQKIFAGRTARRMYMAVDTGGKGRECARTTKVNDGRWRRRPGAARATTNPSSDYELFNRNNFNIRYRSWNYRGCWHQTCPPVGPR